MKPEEQRIAIAEACGWRHLTQFTNRITDPKGNAIFFNPMQQGKEDFIPDYLNDLNAMHEAEKFLFERGDWAACRYEAALQAITTSWAWFATAAQRAEAFLKTIGKWK